MGWGLETRDIGLRTWTQDFGHRTYDFGPRTSDIGLNIMRLLDLIRETYLLQPRGIRSFIRDIIASSSEIGKFEGGDL